MKKKIFIMAILMMIGAAAFAEYVSGEIPINAIQTASSPTFHKFNEVGCSGPTVFISLESSYDYKYGSTGEKPDGTVFLVLDDYHREKGIFKEWYSLLLIARTTGQKIGFSGVELGVTNGRRVIRPYFLTLKD